MTARYLLKLTWTPWSHWTHFSTWVVPLLITAVIGGGPVSKPGKGEEVVGHEVKGSGGGGGDREG